MSAGPKSRLRVAVLLAAAVSGLAIPVASARAEPISDAAAQLFDPSRMYVIHLSLPQASREELADHPFDYQPGTFSFAESDGTPNGVEDLSSPMSVGIRLKGSASFRPLSGKSAFKIKFPKAEPFFGLRVLTLNNMVEDPSMIHETLAYTAFRGADVPGSRTGYAYVYVDGEDYGVHLNIETMDRLALEKRFGPFDPETQHLYESEYEAEVLPDREWMFEIDEGSEDRSDLEALVDAVNSSGPQPWATRVASVIDLEEMTRMWAVEKYIGQWDGYAGMEASWLPNNYYLYSNSGGQFQMLPWGNDETWQAKSHLAFDGRAGLMFDNCLDDDSCFAIYRQAVADVSEAIAGMGLDELARGSAALLAPWQALEEAQSTREEHDCAKIQAGVAETRTFIATRPPEAAAWLGEPLPAPAPAPELLPGACAGSQPGDSTTAGAAPLASSQGIGSPGPRLRVVRAWAAKGALHIRVRLQGSGVASMQGTARAGGKRVLACWQAVRVRQAGTLTLRCRLAAEVRERLRRKWLRITVAARFQPVGGEPEAVTRRVTLPRG